MTPIHYPVDLRSERGFVLVLSLIILVVLTLLGFIAIHSSVIEKKVSSSDRVYKETFSHADAGTELAQQVAYHNAICTSVQGGFTTTDDGAAIIINDLIRVEPDEFLSFYDYVSDDVDNFYSLIDDDNRAFAYYPDGEINDALPHTNFLTTGKTVINAGSGLENNSGYHSGTGGLVGGTSRLLTILSQHQGNQGSESEIEVRWKLNNKVISSASKYDCKY